MNTQNIIWGDKRKKINKLRLLPVVFCFIVLIYLLVIIYQGGISLWTIIAYFLAMICVHDVFNIFVVNPLKVVRGGLLLDPYAQYSKTVINLLTLYMVGYNLLTHKRKKWVLVPWSEMSHVSIFLIREFAGPGLFLHSLIFSLPTVRIFKTPHKRIYDFNSPVFDKKGLLLVLDKLLTKDFSKKKIKTGFKYVRK